MLAVMGQRPMARSPRRAMIVLVAVMMVFWRLGAENLAVPVRNGAADLRGIGLRDERPFPEGADECRGQVDAGEGLSRVDKGGAGRADRGVGELGGESAWIVPCSFAKRSWRASVWMVTIRPRYSRTDRSTDASPGPTAGSSAIRAFGEGSVTNESSPGTSPAH